MRTTCWLLVLCLGLSAAETMDDAGRVREEAKRQEMLMAQGLQSRQPLALGQPQAPATVRRGARFELVVPLTVLSAVVWFPSSS